MENKKLYEKDPNAPKDFHHRCQCTPECNKWIKNPYSKYAHGHFAKDPNNRHKVRNKIVSKRKKYPKDPSAPEGFHHKCMCLFDCGKWVRQPYYAYAQGCYKRVSEEDKVKRIRQRYIDKNSEEIIIKDPSAPKDFHHKCQCTPECNKWVKAPNKLYAQGHRSKLKDFREDRKQTALEINERVWSSISIENKLL